MPLLPHFNIHLFHLSSSGTSLSRLVVKLQLWMSGSRGSRYQYMNRLHSCSTITIGLIRKLLVDVVRDAFYVRFGFRCPRHLQRIRDLSLLPHILHTNRCWMDLYFSEVASLFEMRENDFEMCLHQPSLVNKWDGVNRIKHYEAKN